MIRRLFRVMLPLVVIAACISVRFERPLFANEVTLTPTFDVTTDGLNIFDGPYMRVGNLTGLGSINEDPPLPHPPYFDLRSIVKFDVSSIPSGSTINTVTLKLTQQDLNPQGLANWPGKFGGVEIKGINDNLAFTGGTIATATALELYNAAKISNTTVLVFRFSDDNSYPNAPGTVALVSGGPNISGAFKTRVQDWVNGAIVNHGMAIKLEGSEGFTLTGRQFVSSNVNTPITGDANLDGVVDGFDLKAWQADFGFIDDLTIPKPTDFDTDWDVDGNDFLMLQRAMGSVAGAGPGPLAPMLIVDFTLPVAAGSTVPEPSSVVLVSVGSFLAFSLSRRSPTRSRGRQRPAIE